MEKRHIITISGILGSGKSTTANLVAAQLNYTRYSGGDFMRMLSDERGVTFMQLMEDTKVDPNIDKLVDFKQKEFFETHDNAVVDSRLGWFWVPNSFKVFLHVPQDVSVDRVWEDLHTNPTRKDEQAQSKEEIAQQLDHRLSSERERFLDYYGIADHFDKSHFDLVIDTSHTPPDQVAAQLIEAYTKWLG